LLLSCKTACRNGQINECEDHMQYNVCELFDMCAVRACLTIAPNARANLSTCHCALACSCKLYARQDAKLFRSEALRGEQATTPWGAWDAGFAICLLIIINARWHWSMRLCHLPRIGSKKHRDCFLKASVYIGKWGAIGKKKYQ